MSCASVDEHSDLLTPTEHDQMYIEQNQKLLSPLNWRCHLSKIIPTFLPDTHQMNNLIIEQNCKVPRDRIICCPSYSPVLPHYPRVPSRFVGEITFNMQRQRYEFVDKPGMEIDLSMWFIMKIIIFDITFPTVVNWSQHPLILSFWYKFVLCKDRHFHIPIYKNCEEVPTVIHKM